jgi:hypothetical protein
MRFMRHFFGAAANSLSELQYVLVTVDDSQAGTAGNPVELLASIRERNGDPRRGALDGFNADRSMPFQRDTVADTQLRVITAETAADDTQACGESRIATSKKRTYMRLE